MPLAFNMKKIKILITFPTTHYGVLKAGDEVEVTDHFADYCVNRMANAAEYVVQKKEPVKKIATPIIDSKPKRTGKK